MVYQGTVKHGKIVLEPEADLPEGVRVRIELLPQRPEAIDLADEPLWRVPQLAQETGIDDLATHIDHYLYGHPKPKDAW